MARRKMHFIELASKDNDGTTVNANGNYSVTPASFQIVAPAQETLIIHRVIVSIADGTINDSGAYGELTALSTGIRIYVRDGNDTLIEELTAFPIKTNGEWAAHCHDWTIHTGFGVGDDIGTARWSFDRSGYPVILSASEGHYIEFYLNDNFTGITTHQFLVQGYYESEDY